MDNKNKTNIIGVGYAVAAFGIWGLLPLYWKLLYNINPIEILSNRILWAFIFAAILVTWQKKWDEVKIVISDKKKLMLISLAAITVTFNWGIYIWAVNANHVVETSLGYYINPLLMTLLGVIMFKEKLNLFQIFSLVLAFFGVFVLTIQFQGIPWVALSLSLTFSLYGALKKQVEVSSMVGFTIETGILFPITLIYIIWRHANGIGAIGTASYPELFVLMGSGVATAVPMLLFAQGVRMIRFTTMGFIQYLSPTLILLLGVFAFHEQFTTSHAISFIFIWTALILYSLSQTNFANKRILNVGKN